MRFSTAYIPGDDDEPELAGVEAPDAANAVARLREVVGTDTDILYVIPDSANTDAVDGMTYEAFLHEPGSADENR